MHGPKPPSARASSTELPGKRCARCLSEASLRVPPADRATQRTRRAVQLGWPRGCRGKWPCISPCSPSGRKADQNNHRRCWGENDRLGSWGRANCANQLRINCATDSCTRAVNSDSSSPQISPLSIAGRPCTKLYFTLTGSPHISGAVSGLCTPANRGWLMS